MIVCSRESRARSLIRVYKHKRYYGSVCDTHARRIFLCLQASAGAAAKFIIKFHESLEDPAQADQRGIKLFIDDRFILLPASALPNPRNFGFYQLVE